MGSKQEIEAKRILDVLDQYFPKIFDGKDCINWLHRYTSQGRQSEWQGFFFEEFSISVLKKFLAGGHGPQIIPGKRFDYQREFVWDFKLEAEEKSTGKKNNEVILNDIDATDRVLKFEPGIGYIIAKGKFKYDKSGELKKWRNKKEKKKSKIVKSGAKKRERVLKKRGEITEMFAVFLNKKDFQKAIKNGWIDEMPQGKQPSGSSRKTKYRMKTDKIPKKFVIRL